MKMARDDLKERYSEFLKRIIPACITRGVREINHNDERLVKGLERALEVLRKKRVEVRFKMRGFDPGKFWEAGYSSRVFDGTTRGAGSIRLDFDNERQAYEVLKFNGVEGKQLEAYREAARVFMIEMTGGQGAQPTRHCMRAVGYKGKRGKERT
jgi:hypothetical protein